MSNQVVLRQLLDKAEAIFEMVDKRPDFEIKHPWFITIVEEVKANLRSVEKVGKIGHIELLTISQELNKINRTMKSGILGRK